MEPRLYSIPAARCPYCRQEEKTGPGPCRQDEEGQSLMLVAIMMMLFIAMLGLVIDFGYSNVIQRQMQFAADAASLAGARELSRGSGPTLTGQRIDEVLAANGADVGRSSYTLNGNEVHVTAATLLSPFFVGLFGVNSIPVDSEATAVYGQLSTGENLMPFAIEQNLWAPNQSVVLWGDSHGPGNFGWVRWSGQSPSTPVLRLNIDDPTNSDMLTIGDQVSGQPGVSFNPVQSNLNAWIGQVVTLFLFDPAEVSDSGAGLLYTVRGFARFRLTGTYSHGSNSEIYGQFVEYVTLGGTINAGSTLGYSGVGLIE